MTNKKGKDKEKVRDRMREAIEVIPGEKGVSWCFKGGALQNKKERASRVHRAKSVNLQKKKKEKAAEMRSDRNPGEK